MTPTSATSANSNRDMLTPRAWSRKWQPHSNILAWKIPWTEEPGGLRLKESDMSQRLSTHAGTLGQDDETWYP